MEDNKSLVSVHKPIKVLDGVPMLIICAVVVVALYVLGITGIFSNNLMRYLLKIFLYITLGEMWNLLSGFTGMTSLGQQAFIGMAGYSVAVMTTSYKMSFWMGILVGAVIAIIMSLILSFILFRMRGMYFAIATWVIAEALCVWFKSWGYVGSGSGMSVSAKPYPKTPDIYLMALTLCVIAMIVVYVIAALFTALAGAVFFINKGTIYPDSGFDINWTVSMVFIVIFGGIGTVSGPIIGAVAYVLLDEFLAKVPGWSNIILGAIAILVILFLPDGIMGTLQKKLHFEIFSQKRFSQAKKQKKAQQPAA